MAAITSIRKRLSDDDFSKKISRFDDPSGGNAWLADESIFRYGRRSRDSLKILSMFSLNFRYTDSPLIRSSIFNSLSIEIEITLRVLARQLNARVSLSFRHFR
jgi:hypothetical protein